MSAPDPRGVAQGDIAIRPATDADLEGLTRVQVASWRSSYRGLLSDELLDGIDPNERLAQWRAARTREDVGLFVAAAGVDVQGFCAAGPCRASELGLDAELYAIYLLEAQLGRAWVARCSTRGSSGSARAGGAR